jgi:hypothetical protein
MVAKALSRRCRGEIRTGWTFTLMASCMPMASDGHMVSRVAMYDVDSEDCVLNLGQGQSLTIVCSKDYSECLRTFCSMGVSDSQRRKL